MLIKKNIVAVSTFLILALFNLLFPPYVFFSETGVVIKRLMFVFIFGDVASNGAKLSPNEIDTIPFVIDLRTLFILILISLVISLFIQGLYNLIRKKTSLESK